MARALRIASPTSPKMATRPLARTTSNPAIARQPFLSFPFAPIADPRSLRRDAAYSSIAVLRLLRDDVHSFLAPQGGPRSVEQIRREHGFHEGATADELGEYQVEVCARVEGSGRGGGLADRLAKPQAGEHPVLGPADLADGDLPVRASDQRPLGAPLGRRRPRAKLMRLP